MNIFETRTMLEALKVSPPAQSFLRDRYFSNVRTFTTQRIDIDIVKGKRRIAPFVHPKIGGKTVEREGYRTDSYEAPEVSPDMITTAEDILNRQPGQPIYGGFDPNRAAAEQLGADLAELDEMITRREEVMCAEALFTGQINIKGDGYDEVLRYWPTNPAEQPYKALAGNAVWDGSEANPLADLREARRAIIQSSGVTPRDAIMGTDALEAFLSALGKMEVELDYRRVDMGIIDPDHLPNGVTYWGYLKDSALDIFTYDEWYLDDNGDEKPMVPSDLVLIGSPSVRTTMAYGLVTLMRGSDDNAAPEFYAERRVPDSWVQRKNPAGRIVQVKSRPLPIIHQIDGFRVLKVLA